jgi:hypothetical protein
MKVTAYDISTGNEIRGCMMLHYETHYISISTESYEIWVVENLEQAPVKVFKRSAGGLRAAMNYIDSLAFEA